MKKVYITNYWFTKGIIETTLVNEHDYGASVKNTF